MTIRKRKAANRLLLARFEDFIDVIPRGSCKIRRVGGTYRFHHHSGTVGELMLIVIANVVPCSLFLLTLMMEAVSSFERRFLQETRGVTYQNAVFFRLLHAWNEFCNT
jgi:hypothetical protein